MSTFEVIVRVAEGAVGSEPGLRKVEGTPVTGYSPVQLLCQSTRR